MQQFDLSLWLQDKSRKVVTRRGNPVRIICIDRKHGKDDLPIVFLEENNGGEFLLTCRKDGRSETYDTPYDLFFAGEEGLTEFEKAVDNIINYPHFQDEQAVKQFSKALLDLARKELLKDLPKWKKITKREQNYLVYGYLSNDEYYLSIQELKDKLPKEE